MLLLSFDHQDHISEIRGLCSTYENPCAIFSNYKDISTSSFILYKKKLQHEKWKKSTWILVIPNIMLVFKVILKNLIEHKPLISED